MQISKNFLTICAIALLASIPSLRAADTDAQAKAREELRKKMAELDAQEKGLPAPTPTTPPAPVKVSPDQPTYAPVLQTADDEATARARAATRQKIAELEAQQSAGKPAPADAGPAKGQVASEPKPEFKSVAAPPLPISGSKEARLAELLRRYKADEITPDEYHRQRAKTLAEP